MTLSARVSYIGHVDRFHSATRRAATVSSADCCHWQYGGTVSRARLC